MVVNKQKGKRVEDPTDRETEEDKKRNHKKERRELMPEWREWKLKNQGKNVKEK